MFYCCHFHSAFLYSKIFLHLSIEIHFVEHIGKSFKLWFMVFLKHLSLAIWSSSYIIILGYKTLNTSAKQIFHYLCFYIIFSDRRWYFFLTCLLIEKLNKAPNDLDVKMTCYSSAWWSLRPWYWKTYSHLLKHESSLSFLGRLHRTVN